MPGLSRRVFEIEMEKISLFVFSATGSGLANLSKAYRRFASEFSVEVHLYGASGTDFSDPEKVNRFLGLLQNASEPVLLMRLHGGRTSCLCFDDLMRIAENKARIFFDPQNDDDMKLNRKYCREIEEESFQNIVRYFKFDGERNWYNLIRYLAHLPADPPEPLPTEALYHPELGAVGELETYIEKLGYDLSILERRTIPIIGCWFFPQRWIEGDLEHVDALVREIERQGCLPVCCFYRRAPMPMLDSKDTKWVRDRYFMRNGKTIVDAFINLMTFSLTLIRPKESHLMGELDVPMLQAMELFTDYEKWSETYQGVSPLDVCASFAQPEIDGNIISVPAATREMGLQDPFTGAFVPKLKPIPDRISKIVRLAKNWANLKRKANIDKKIAIIFHNYPPRNDTIGTAIGLDSFQSVSDIVAALDEDGYRVDRVYDDPQELADEIVSGLTCDGRWLTPDAMARKAVDTAGSEFTAPWTGELPERNRDNMEAYWGPAPGELFVYDREVLINGHINGNVYIGVQPPRGRIEQKDKIHDPKIPPSHHYLYYYRWIRDVFKADAVLHIGTHGTLEWLPGKSAGLSTECYPELAIMDLPNIYPYIINNPSEGIQAKRRSFACMIDHLIPVMTNADLYDGYTELDNKLAEYHQVKSMNPSALPVIRQQVIQAIRNTDLKEDLASELEKASSNYDEAADFDGLVEKIHSYLTEISDTAIAKGLHSLGRPPEGDGLVELVTQMVRVKNGDVPSLREAVAEHWGYSLDDLLASPGRQDPTGRYLTYSQVIKEIHSTSLQIVRACIEKEKSPLPEVGEIERVAQFVDTVILPKLARTTDEIYFLISALSGKFVPPGGSGNPTRGQIDILPTGRNFYGVDPEKVPTQSAWKVGVSMAEELLARYRKETGKPLDTMAMVLWGINTMRNWGEDLAQALYLMGVKPVWNGNNARVEGLEIIPLKDLKNPRVDITFRISGFFRDGFPNVVELMDDAVMMVAALNEPPEDNMLRKAVVREMEELTRKGLSEEEAFREAGFRIYSCPPGTYGAGVADAIYAKAWETGDDLGEVYVHHGGYAYGKGVYGEDKRDNFRQRLSKVSLVVKNEDSREYDLFSSDDFNSYFGGLIAAVKKESGVMPKAYAGDASDPDRVKYRSVSEEIKHLFRSKVLNPKWIESMMEHGFKGAGDLSRTTDFVFHWDATSEVIEDWMYQALADKYVFDEKMRAWMKDVNVNALQNITERLLEAINRNMWQTDEQTIKELESIYLDVEGDIEEFNE